MCCNMHVYDRMVPALTLSNTTLHAQFIACATTSGKPTASTTAETQCVIGGLLYQHSATCMIDKRMVSP